VFWNKENPYWDNCAVKNISAGLSEIYETLAGVSEKLDKVIERRD
jgi:hypothetical protein